jgi:soluble lytic murein transglycosylase-like protein
MALISPKVRAQCERARKPAIMFTIGMALAVPASTFMARIDAANHAHTARVAAARAAAVAATSSVAATADSNYAIGYDTSAKAGEPSSITASLAELFGVPMDLAKQIHTVAQAEGIAPRVAFGLVHTESRFKPTAVSHVGAIGLTQVMPNTARWLKPGTTRTDLFDPTTNLHLGFKYLHSLIDQYNGNVRLALTAYNRGPGTVQKVMKRGRNPENGYADMVLRDPAPVRSALSYTSEWSQTRVSAAPAKATGGRQKSSMLRKHLIKPKASHKAARKPHIVPYRRES